MGTKTSNLDAIAGGCALDQGDAPQITTTTTPAATLPECIVAAIRAAETPANSEACGHLAAVILGDGPAAARSAWHLVEHTCWGEGFTGTDAAAAITHVRQAAEQEFLAPDQQRFAATTATSSPQIDATAPAER